MNRAQAVLVLTRDSVYRKDPEIYVPPSPRYGNDEEETQELQPTGFKLLNIFPNPFSQHFTVEYVFDEEVERLVVEVFDVQGRLLVTEGQQNVQAGKFNLDLSCCAEGTYICRVIADGAVVETQRIVHSK